MAYCITRNEDGRSQFWRVIQGIPIEVGKSLPDEYVADDAVVARIFPDASNASKLLRLVDYLDDIAGGEVFGDGARELLNATMKG